MNNTKDIIIKNSEILFREKGYNGTSMREIAAASGIAVGNLCYYFPKKEDLYYYFYQRLFATLTEELEPIFSQGYSPWVYFFAREYIIFKKFFVDPVYRKQALDAINIPVFREHYCRDYYLRISTFMQSINAEYDPEKLLDYSIIICSSEMQLFEAHIHEGTEASKNVFNTVMRLQFNISSVTPERQEEVIQQVMDVSEKFLKAHPDLLTTVS